MPCCGPGLVGHYLTRPGDLRASRWFDSHSIIHSTNIYPAPVAPLSRNKTNKTLPLCGVDSMGGDRTFVSKTLSLGQSEMAPGKELQAEVVCGLK